MKWIRRIWIRQKILVILYMIQTCFLLLANAVFICAGMSGFDLLYNLIRVQYVMVVAWMLHTVLLVTKASACDQQECINCCKKNSIYYESMSVVWLLLICLFCNILVSIELIVGAVVNDAAPIYFISWFLKDYLINILLPQYIAIIFTGVVCMYNNNLICNAILLIFAFLISPYSEKIIWKQSSAMALVWTEFHHVFEILYQNSEWSPDAQYGFQTEYCRVELECAWMLGLCVMMLCKAKVPYMIQNADICNDVLQRIKKRGMTVLTTLMLIISCLLYIDSIRPSSTYRLTENYSGAFSDRETYYKNLITEGGEEEWKVTEYDIDLNLGKQLDVELVMKVESEESRSTFLFTLYHGYKVAKVATGTPEIELQFVQEDDRLQIKSNKPVTKLDITIDYSGYCNRFYSNSEACMLPGWFPWYPMAGEKVIFGHYQEAGNPYGYNPYNRIDESHIVLRLNRQAVTSLDQKEMGSKCFVYEGYADHITVLCGNFLIMEENSNDKESAANDGIYVKSLLPLTLYSSTDIEETKTKIKNELEESIEQLETYFGEQEKWKCSELKIMVASEDLSRNFFNNNLAIFSDSILIANGTLNANTLLQYELLADRTQAVARAESQIISNCLRCQYLENTPEETLKNLIRNLGIVANDTSIVNEFIKLAQAAADNGKSIMFLSKLFEYEKNPKSFDDDEKFIEYFNGNEEFYDRNSRTDCEI